MGLVLAVLAGFFAFVFISSDRVVASELGSDGTPAVAYSHSLSFQKTPRCSTYYATVDVVGISGKTRACMFGGKESRFAVAFPDNGDINLLYSPPFTDVFHKVLGACVLANCTYNPEADVLISRFYAQGGLVGMRLFKNVRQRMKLEVGGDQIIRFRFDATMPDYQFRLGDRALAVEGVALSNNGKWAAFEQRGYGIYRLDTETLDLRRIRAPGYRYGVGFDAQTELAISDTGKLVAVTGEHAGQSVIAVDETCGDRLTNDTRENFAPTVTICRSVSVDPTKIVSNYRGSYDPYFYGDERFDVTIVDKNWQSTRVGYESKANNARTRLPYLALGDSFVSGEGETDDAYYFAGTNEGHDKCHLSKRSYPFLVAEILNINKVRSVACSGAKVADVLADQTYYGQGERLGRGGVNLGLVALADHHRRALDLFQPGWAPQGWFVSQYKPELVTIGIGGNDAGLMTKLKACAGLGECEWVTEEGRRKTFGELQAMHEKLVTFFRSIIQLSPNSRLMVIGYPRPIKGGATCDPVTTALLNLSERTFMTESISHLNHVIKYAADTAGITFIDVENALMGHELCASSNTPAMNGLRSGDDGLVAGIPLLKIIGNESFHPTPIGHALMAQIISAVFQQNSTVCTGCGQAPPWNREYWGEVHETLSRHETFAFPEVGRSLHQRVLIETHAMTFRPGSQIRVEIHSSPRLLSTLHADIEGKVQATLTLPTDIEPGFHTLHLYGETIDQQSLELYQELEYKPTKGEIAEEIGDIRNTKSDTRDHSGSDELILPAIIHHTKTYNPVGGSVKGATTNSKHDESSETSVPESGGLLFSLLLFIFVLLVGYCLKRKLRKSVPP